MRRWLHRWFRSRSQVPTSEASRVLAEVLECWGRYAFDLPSARRGEIQARFRQLAQSVQDNAAQEIVRGVCQHRQAEQQFVMQSCAGLQELAWSFINGLARLLQEDSESNREMRRQLQQLGDIKIDEIQTLRSTLQTLIQVLETRERKHQQTLQRMQSQMHHLIQELEQARKESYLDPLTGLYNRRALENHLQNALDLYCLFGYASTLILIDVDNFKGINDTWGHVIGDVVIQHVGECIVRVCKRRGDFVARYGGEEFAVILRETSLREANTIAQRILHSLSQEPIQTPSGATFTVTASAGVGVLQAGDTVNDWFERTDQMLYRAKHGGKNQVKSA